MRRLLAVSCLCLNFSVLGAQEVPSLDLSPPDEKASPKVGLDKENYEAWRDHILPARGDLAWEQIPWHATFHAGISAADAARKPLLLWVMNGHPLGCT